MVIAVPAVAAYELLGGDAAELRLIGPNQTWLLEVPTASLLVAVTFVLMALALYELSGVISTTVQSRKLTALSAALIFTFGTSAWSTAGRSLWAHTPAMALAALSLLILVRRLRSGSLYALGVALCLSFWMRPTSAIALAVVGFWVFFAHRKRFWGLFGGIASVSLPIVGLNLIFYGSALPPYFNPLRVSTVAAYPLGESLAVHLVSPSRGLLVYSPLFLLLPWGFFRWRAIGGDCYRVAQLSSAIGLGSLLVVAAYGSTGGASYGSRFFTEVLPYLMVLVLPIIGLLFEQGARSRAWRIGVVALALVGVLFAGVGAGARSAFCWSAGPVFVDYAPGRVWSVSDPQFLRPFRDLSRGASIKQVIVGSCSNAVERAG